MSAEAAFAIVTGGGTSGHVLPALAVADGLVAAGHPPASIHYVGTERGVEARLLPPTAISWRSASRKASQASAASSRKASAAAIGQR